MNMGFASTLQADIKEVATDIVVFGGSATAVLAVVNNLATTLHASTGEQAILVSITTLVASIVSEAKRVVSGNSNAVLTSKATPKPTSVPEFHE